MRSIRTYLLLTLLATITAVTFLSLLLGYRSSLAKTDALFDERLKNLASIIVHANHDVTPRVEKTLDLKPSVFFQIWSHEGVLIARSGNAPEQQMFNRPLSEGFHDSNYADFRWRTYILQDMLFKRWVVTGERIDLRYEIADKIVLSAIKPTVMAIPLAAFIIWLTVGFGLKPLRELTKQLANKKADDLSAISMNQQPKELEQLRITTNDLLQRLNAAFVREQQFSADAAHELRTPISTLKVQLHNLISTKGVADGDLEPLKEGVERMGHVIEQILSLYKHSPDQAAQQMEPLNLTGIAKTVIANEYMRFESKKQRISLNAEPVCFIKGNEFALESLLQNLILNANKYTPAKGVISVNIKSKGNTVKLCIEDSGPGIAEEDRARVFERFYRVGGDRHASGILGCGLGLAIVQHISTFHGATVRLAMSAELGGLKVTVEFPAV